MSKKKSFRVDVVLLVLFFFMAIVMCNRRVTNSAMGKCYDEVGLIPHNKVGLLLGTAPRLGNGCRNAYFDYRIEATVNLYKAGKIDYVLISGDNRKQDYNEPEEMRNALVAGGIPSEKIVLDYAGFRTLDSVVRADKVFGQKSFTIISQKFHNERALYLAEYFGIDAIALNAKDVSAFWGFKTKCREVLARVKLFIDLQIGKQPKFLGEKIEIQ